MLILENVNVLTQVNLNTWMPILILPLVQFHVQLIGSRMVPLASVKNVMLDVQNVLRRIIVKYVLEVMS